MFSIESLVCPIHHQCQCSALSKVLHIILTWGNTGATREPLSDPCQPNCRLELQRLQQLPS